MRTELFEHEMTQTSTVFGRKSDVRVAFDQNGARTDGNTVYLPTLARGKDIPVQEQMIMRGYTDHEAGHLRHSDMKLIRKKYEEYAKRGDKLAKEMHNCFEDVWLERRVMADYPGARRNLSATAEAVNAATIEGLEPAVVEEPDLLDNPKRILSFATTWLGRREYGGPHTDKLCDMVGPRVTRMVESLLPAIVGARNTKEIFDLSEAVCAALRDPSKPWPTDEGGDDPRRASEGDGDGDGDGEASEGEASKDGEASEDGKDGEGKSESKSGEDGDGEGELVVAKVVDEKDEDGEDGEAVKPDIIDKDGAKKKAGEAEAEGGLELLDAAKVIGRMLDADGLTGGKGAYLPHNTENDVWISTKGLSPTPKNYSIERSALMLREHMIGRYDAGDYFRSVSEMRGPVNVLRRAMARALMAQQTLDWEGGKLAGKLDTRRLAAAVSGRESVFKTRTDRPELDTAVTFLVDLSGSMAGMEAEMARDCVIALIEAIAPAGIPFEVLGFNQPFNTAGAGTVPMTAARWEAIAMYVFKAFEQSLRETRGSIYSIGGLATGNNCDGESLMYAYDRLRKRPESRKVMFVLSDGAPSCMSRSPGLLSTHLKNSVHHMEKNGVQCVGIGIYTHSVKHYYPRHIVVNSLDELASTSLTMLGDLLLDDGKGRSRMRHLPEAS